jgi:hypothetical protein
MTSELTKMALPFHIMNMIPPSKRGEVEDQLRASLCPTERKIMVFLLKFGEESPQKLIDIMSTPERYAVLENKRADARDGAGNLIGAMVTIYYDELYREQMQGKASNG